MDETNQLEQRAEEFLRNKEKSLFEICEQGSRALIIDFNELDRFDPLITDRLFESPDEVLNLMERAVDNIDLPEHEKIRIRIKNIPKHRNIRIRNLRANHLEKLLEIDGIVKAASEVKPQIYEAVFQCPECGNKISVEQKGSTLRTPNVCECGRRGIFKLVETKKYDIRWLTVDEPYEITTGEMPGKINVLLKEDLTTPEMQKKTDPGNQLKITGVLKEIQKFIQGKLSTKPDVFFEANYVEPKEEEFEDIKITEQDRQQIEELAKDPNIYEKLIASIAPGIYGFNEIKEAILLQLFGGIRHEFEDGTHVRGNIHILITGDPSVAKSQLISLVVKTLPRGRYVSGKGVTGAGLTATVSKNELLGGWILEAGALVLSNKSVLAIDEFDKMNKDDQIAMHEGMSLESISIAKASIVASLPSQTSILAAANPRLGRFDPYLSILEQVQIPETLMSVDYEEPIMIRENGIIKIEKIGEFVDKFYTSKEGDANPVFINNAETAAFNAKTFKTEWWPIQYVFKHKIDKELFEVILDTGRKVKLTSGHSIYVFENGEIKTKTTDKIRTGDYVVIPKKLPNNNFEVKEFNLAKELLNLPETCKKNIFLHNVSECAIKRLKIKDKNWIHGKKLPLEFAVKLTEEELKQCVLKYKGGVKNAVPVLIPVNIDLMRLLGYYIADGSLTLSKSSEHIISLCFNKKEEKLIEDAKKISRKLFNHEAKTISYYNSIKVNIANKMVFLFFDKILKLEKGAVNKRVPNIVFNVPSKLQKEFIQAYFFGDYGVSIRNKNDSKNHFYLCEKKINTFSHNKNLISDLLYLLLQNGIIASFKENNKPRAVTFPRGHTSISKTSFSISDAKLRMKDFKSIKWYSWIPLEPIKDVIKSLSNKKYKGNYYGKKKNAKWITGSDWWNKNFLRQNMIKKVHRLKLLQEPLTADEFSVKVYKANKISRAKREWSREYLNRLLNKEFVKRKKANKFYQYYLSEKGEDILKKIEIINKLISGNLGFTKVKKIKKVKPTNSYVYDVSTPGHENFIAGFGGIFCHNTRFDLKFALKDIPDLKKDEELVEHITKSRTNPEITKPLINTKLLRKYITYARKNCDDIKLTEEASNMLKKFYVDLRNKYTGEDALTVPITLRQYEALLRLAEASAKVRLEKYVRKQDAERAIKLMRFSLQQLGIDIETGKLDIDKIESGITTTQRSRIRVMLDIIANLETKMGSKNIAVEDVKAAAEEQGIGNADELIERLKHEGLIFLPKAGFVRKV